MTKRPQPISPAATNGKSLWFFPGAQRVGTHFQLNTMMDALRQKNIPFYHEPGSALDANNLPKFLENIAARMNRPESYFLLNNHWRTRAERDLLLATYPDALFFLIWRDFRDALVSYYHFLMKRRNRTFQDFSHYYWTEGWQFLWRQTLHYRTWHEIGENPRVFHADYSQLAGNFAVEAARMMSFAGLQDVDFDALQKGVSIESRRASDGDKQGDFYRKGKVGEYAEVVSNPRIRAHVEQALRWGDAANPALRALYYLWLKNTTRTMGG